MADEAALAGKNSVCLAMPVSFRIHLHLDRGMALRRGFLDAIYSHVFGDETISNEQMEGKRLHLASNMIRQNNGAETAEKLAPFVMMLRFQIAVF